MKFNVDDRVKGIVIKKEPLQSINLFEPKSVNIRLRCSFNFELPYVLHKLYCQFLLNEDIGATAIWDPWDRSPPTLEDEGTRYSWCPPILRSLVQIFISFYQKCLMS